MVISQGDLWWADIGEPRGSEPGYRRPVVIVQGDAFNRSRISTIACVAVTSNMRQASAPGNVVLTANVSGLAQDAVANVSQIVTLDRTVFVEHVARLPAALTHVILAGIDIVLRR